MAEIIHHKYKLAKMGCTSCGTKNKEGEAVAGCGSTGGCSTGGCNRSNVYDWFSNLPLSFNENFSIVEVSFKKGARKGYYRNTDHLDLYKGQLIVVESVQGFDVGEVNLQGELVKAQMKKRKISEREDIIRNIVRIANEQDIDLLLDCRNKENEVMVKARAIARTHKIEMKIGDIEFQGDGKKLTVYYTADDRVDFRELVKVYAREFKTKIEMRQIGARQEAARIGGIGTCGRELCCSTWLTDFKSVTTNAVRYQNLAINTEKLSGQCGRLKCCLNYELDTYNDAMKSFPRQSDKIETEDGIAWLKKTEILKQLLWYEFDDKRGAYFKLSVGDAKELLLMNKSGKKPKSLENYALVEAPVDESKHDDLVGQVSLSTLEDKERKKRRQNQHKQHSKKPMQQGQQKQGQGQNQKPAQGQSQRPPNQGQNQKPNQGQKSVQNQNQNKPKQGPPPQNK